MPTLSKWISDGSHKLVKWETDLSSQTSSSQAGILHGNNNNIPAFRWVEKEKDNRIISSNGRTNSELREYQMEKACFQTMEQAEAISFQGMQQTTY